MNGWRDAYILLCGFFAVAGMWMALTAHFRLDKLRMLLNDKQPLLIDEKGNMKQKKLDF